MIKKFIHGINIMKAVKNKVTHQVSDQIWDQVRDKVWYQVSKINESV